MPPVGLPQGGEFFRLQKFKGLNTKSTRISIEDEEFAWLENFIPIGDGNLRAMPGPGSATYTTPGGKTIAAFQPFNILSTFYHAVFLSDGSMDVVNDTSLAVTSGVFGAGTFTTTPPPNASQWGSQYLLIIDVAKGYFIWDGTTTYFGTTGSSPNTASLAPGVTITNAGTGYTSAPSVSASGGHGSGTSFTAVVQGGSVVKIIINNAGTGYQPGDTVTLSITGGGGSSAAATVTLMPTALAGTDVEVFNSRVWIINAAFLTFSAPSSVSNFAISAGGGAAQATDSVLRVGFTALRQATGFLYPIADSSIDVINNVQTVNGVTTFNDTNVDPQIGTVWRDTTTVFGRAIMLANLGGVYGLYGGAAEKVSPALDGIFPQLQPSQFNPNPIPTSAQALVFGIRLYIVLLNITDPFAVTRPLMFCWDGTKWFVASQANNNIFQINTLYKNSIPFCYATDGQTIFRCFSVASSSLNKKLQTKLWDGGNPVVTKESQRLFVEMQDNVGQGVTLTGSVDSSFGTTAVSLTGSDRLTFVNNSSGVIQFQNNLNQNLFFSSIGTFQQWQNVSFSGKELGVTLNSTSPDFTLKTISLLYLPTTAY